MNLSFLRNTTKQKYVSFILFILFAAVVIFGGIGEWQSQARIFGLAVGVIFLIVSYVLKRKIVFPKGFFFYVLFLVLAAFWFFAADNPQNYIQYFLLYVGGGIFLVAFYNFSEIAEKWMEKLIVFSGIIFSLIFFISLLLGVKRPLLSLAIPNIERFNHHHIGDFWALVLVIAVSWFLNKKRKIHIILGILGVVILVISSSRSAAVAAVGATAYLLAKTKSQVNRGKFLKWTFVFFVAIFLFFGLNKSTILSRVYFLEALDGFIKHPLGVGLGNFIEISRRSPFSFTGGRYFVASMTHNLLLEVLIGIGVFALSFFVWLGQALWDIWKNKNENRVIFGVLSLALFINFLFDFTYFSPAMLWLWFSLLGLAQTKKG